MKEMILTRWKRLSYTENNSMARDLYFDETITAVAIIYKNLNIYLWEIYPNSKSNKILFQGAKKSMQDAINEVDQKLKELGYRFEEEPNIGLLI